MKVFTMLSIFSSPRRFSLMRLAIKSVLTLLLMLSSSFIMITNCSSQTTYTWSGTFGNWSNSSKWTPNGIPGSSDTVLINRSYANPVCIIDQNAECAKLVLGRGVGTYPSLQFTSSPAFTLTVKDSLLVVTGTLTIGSLDTLNLHANGTIIASGGSLTGGTVNFIGAGTVSGTIAFNNVIMNADSLDFGTASTINGIFQINGGGVKWIHQPTYGWYSTLKYATNYTIAGEWTSSVYTPWDASGNPRHVQVSNNSTLHFTPDPTDSLWSARGDFIIDAGSTAILDNQYQQKGLWFEGSIINNGTFTSPSGNMAAVINVGGDWIKGASATSNLTGLAVQFFGNGDKSITAYTGNETFGSICLKKQTGGIVRLSSNPATNITINSTDWNALWLWDGGSLDLNGQTMTFTENGGQIHVNNTVRSITGPPSSTLVFNGTKSVTTENGGSLSIGSNVTVKVNGNNIDFGGTATTINGTLEIDGGSVSVAPLYAAGSTLKYSTTYARSAEWNTATPGTPGCPWHVQVSNNSTLDIGARLSDVLTGWLVVGNLTIDAGTTVTMNGPYKMQTSIDIAGNLINNGTLIMSELSSGDININGNWIKGTTGVFTHNWKAVRFIGSNTQTISSATGSETFSLLFLTKSSGNVVLSPGTNVILDATWRPLWLWDGGSIDLNGQTLTFTSNGGEIMASGAARMITGPVGSTIIFNGTKTVNVETGGSLSIGSNVTVQVYAPNMNFNGTNTTINGTLEIKGGSVSVSPVYAIGSTLKYNTTSYWIGNEWRNNVNSGYGVPSNVFIESGTALGISSLSNRTMSGSITINGSFWPYGSQLNIGGNWTRNPGGTWHAPGNVQFNGSGTQTITTPDSETFTNLAINKSSGTLILANNIMVGSLTLTQGNIITGSHSVNLGGGGVSRTSGWIVGSELKSFNEEYTFTFDVGDAIHYTPVVVQTSDWRGLMGTLMVKSNPGEHPQISSSGIDAAKSVNRYFTLTSNAEFQGQPEGLTVTLNFLASDVDGAANSTNFRLNHYDGQQWWVNSMIGSTATSVQIGSAIETGDYAIGEAISGPWIDQTSGITTNLENISIVDDRVTWAAGWDGVVVRTTDGGTTWQQYSIPGMAGWHCSILGVSDNIALAWTNQYSEYGYCYSHIYRTSDAGATWNLVYQYSVSGTQPYLDDVHMFDTLNGVAVGNPVVGQWMLLKTSDGGNTWSSLCALPQTSGEKGMTNSFEWVGTQNGWFGTDHPWIYRTTDGGSSWSAIPCISSPTQSLSFINDSVGMAAGSVIQLTTNGGAAWDSIYSFANTSPRVAGMDTPTEKWWVAQYSGYIRLSTDRGNTWSFSHMGPGRYNQIKMKKIDAADIIVGYAVGSNGMISRYSEQSSITLQIPVDAKWNLVSVPLILGDYRKDSLFKNSVSDAYKYIPASSYEKADTIENGIGYWLKYSEAENVPVCGKGIFIDSFKVEQGWNIIGSISVPIQTVDILSNPSGMVTSEFYKYDGHYKITDTIQSGKGYWIKVNKAGTLILSSSTSKNLSERIKIVPTSEMPPPSPSDGIETEQLPRTYELEQNYPNPFNPMTSIKYALPFDSKVKLTIYNVLGQIVNVLVNGTEPAGYKSFEWNAMNAASGIYFYKLEATNTIDPTKNFIEVKKMLLVK
jgi:photosystem II stability/assembly factor-like uncharacterized protein